MSILGTCPECLHHTDGMCDLRPRICLNYDHFERRPMVTLTRDDFEKLYISRAAYDELNAKVAALRADLEYERHFTDAIRKVEKTLDVYLRQTGGGPEELINGMLKFNDELKEDNAALTAALRDIYEACYAADCDGELDYRINGEILDAARIVLEGGEK